MHDRYISSAKLICCLLWAKALALVILTWVLALIEVPDDWHRAVVLTGVLALSIATVFQIRLSLLRLGRLIRVSAGLETPDADVRQLVPDRERPR